MMSASVRTKMGGFSSPTGMRDSSKFGRLAFLWAPPSLRFGAGGLLWSSTLVTSLCHVVEVTRDSQEGLYQKLLL